MRKRFFTVFCVLSALFIPFLSAFGRLKTDSSIRFLREIRSEGDSLFRERGLLRAEAGGDYLVMTVKFDHVLDSSEIESCREQGLTFYYIDGEIARTGSIYPVITSWEGLEGISAREEVLALEGAWNPAVLPCLDISVPEVGADSAWGYHDDYSLPLTGNGMVIADFDTGIDVFHPSFFRADGDTFQWLDVNENGTFDSGTDAVDMDGDAQADPGETLAYFDGWLADYAGVFGGELPDNQGNGFQAYWDWLYNDENGNGFRDYGPGAGFSDTDPTFGELIFIVIDNDRDGDLDPGEKLAALSSSKIYATMNADSVERVRGVDIILSDDDTSGHGTAVSGILAGGTPGRHRFTGIAPDSDLLMGYYFSGNPISLLVPWARARGADVMLYEFGGFVWDYLDGSSLDEEIISIESENILQVTPSGNLGRGRKHAIAAVPGGGTVTLDIDAAVVVTDLTTELYSTTLWRTGLTDLSFRLETPRGGEITLAGGAQYQDGFYIWSDTSESSRGTCKLDILVNHNTNGDVLGDWHLSVDNNTGNSIEIISNITDNVSAWRYGAEFTNYFTDQRNVTWPATADSSMVNGSYSTRGFEGYGGTGLGRIQPGDISAFSGRGRQIDGKRLLDVCSPGNYDIYTVKSHTDQDGYPIGGYRQFSGTSAAGPHVAAAAALVMQRWPEAGMNDVARQLTARTLADGFTGGVPNDTWGYGKLRVLAAIEVMTGIEGEVSGDSPPILALGSNYPNPFNPSTWIPFYIPESGEVSLRIYDVSGRLLRTLWKGHTSSGFHGARWEGLDRRGNRVSSGVYFCVLSWDGKTRSRKLVLLR